MLSLFLAASVAATQVPAPAPEWWLIEVERPPTRSGPYGAIYADRASVTTRGGISRVSVLGIADRPPPEASYRVELGFEVRCAANEMRAASSRLLDSSGRPLSSLEVNSDLGFRSVERDGRGTVARLACSDDRDGMTRLPSGTSPAAHAAALFAEMRRPPPPPPPLSPEEEALLAHSARLMELEILEDVARNALAEACGEADACRGFEGSIMRGVEPVIAVEALSCGPAAPGDDDRRDCRFEARHPGNGRAVSCTVEIRQRTGHHGPHPTYLRPVAPVPPGPGPQLPSMPPRGPSSLACSGPPAALISP